LDATREIRRTLPEIEVLMLSQHDSPEMMRQALRAGARGYVVKSSISSDLIQGIETMRRGELFFDGAVSSNNGHSNTAAGAQVENDARDTEERFGLTFAQSAVGIAHVSKDGRWLRFNQKVCDITGYTEQELRRKRFQDITHSADLKEDEEQASRVAD